jgi:biotin transport system ATP-binding protein
VGATITDLVPTPSPVLIKTTDVSFEVEGKAILRDISLEAGERRIGIVGRNGSGKSTLARLLAGLTSPTRGSIRVDGLDVGQDRKAALSSVGILFQNSDHQIIFPTVEEELAFGLLQQGHSKSDAADQVDAILARFDKAHWAKHAVHQLSQGQKRLVCLMAVLAMGPKVILLDEPFAGLDIPTQIQLARYLDGVEAMLVHISHEPSHLQTCERIIWLEGGAVALDGSREQVLPAFQARMNELGGLDDISDLAG